MTFLKNLLREMLAVAREEGPLFALVVAVLALGYKLGIAEDEPCDEY